MGHGWLRHENSVWVTTMPPGFRMRVISSAASHGRSMCSKTSEEKIRSNRSSSISSAQPVMSAMIVFGTSDGAMLRS